jgi:hypothetical protein
VTPVAKACPRRPGERRTHRQVELRRHHPGGLVDPPAERLPRRPSPKSNCNSSTIKRDIIGGADGFGED